MRVSMFKYGCLDNSMKSKIHNAVFNTVFRDPNTSLKPPMVFHTFGLFQNFSYLRVLPLVSCSNENTYKCETVFSRKSSLITPRFLTECETVLSGKSRLITPLVRRLAYSGIEQSIISSFPPLNS